MLGARGAWCVATGPCGQLAGEWKAAPCLPGRPPLPSCGLLGPGTFVSAQDGVKWGSFPLLPLFLPFLSLFSAAGHVSSSPKEGAEWVPACGHGTWWDSGGSVPSVRRTADLESDSRLAVFLLQ